MSRFGAAVMVVAIGLDEEPAQVLTWARVGANGALVHVKGRGDYLNVGLAVTGIPPKTRFSLAFDGGAQWRQYSMSTGTATRTSCLTLPPSL